jgi:tetrapyrrole methylase family protein/MazG family protein
MKRKTTFNDLVKVMHRLRAPGGCPWDRQQTHESLLKYLKEESKEVVEAVRKKDWLNLEEELGDILLQVLFHAELASERGAFDISDVLATLKSKLIGRHPHVFGKGKKDKLTAQDVLNRWDALKKTEKAKRMAARARRIKLKRR